MVAIMKSLCFSFIILSSFASLFSVAVARRFYVGGNGVWVINPQDNYRTWAERNRFQVNDTLYFKYAKGSDSVQQVMKADFDACNIRNPFKNFNNGETEFTLDRSGPFYFISGNEDHCKKGQKLIVVVLAVRNHPTVPISPKKPPKSPSPVSPIAPAKSPSVTQPPKSPTPVSPVSPATSPSKSQPPKSSSPVSHSPTVSPSHAPAKSPTAPSPSPKSPSPASSLSPSNPPKSSASSDQAPTSSTPDQTPPLSPSPSETTPTADNVAAPAPSTKSSASGVAVTSVMTTVLSFAITVFMLA